MPLNQTWNGYSAKTVADEFRRFHPSLVSSFHATHDKPLLKADVRRITQEVATAAKSQELDFLVVYFIGHMLVRDDGEITLLTGDSSFNTINSDPNSTLTLRELYESLTQAERPFVIFVDGCLESNLIDKFREKTGFVLPGRAGQMNYFGSADLITDELTQFQKALDIFAAKHIYLHTANPVILGAKPGTVAPGVRDPKNGWGARHGPLAERIVRMRRVVQSAGSNRPLHKLVRGTVDFNRVGQITSEGTISWSDFATFRLGGLANPKKSIATRITTNPFSSGINRVEPFTDGSGYWIHDNNGDIWRYSAKTKTKSKIAEREPFKTVVSLPGSDGHLAYNGWSYNVTSYSAHHGAPRKLIDKIEIGVLKGAPGLSALAIEDNGDISVPDRVFQFTSDGVKKIAEVESSEIFDIASHPSGSFFITKPDQGVVIEIDQGMERLIAGGLTEPTRIFFSDGFVYVISGDGLKVYRINKNRQIQSISVQDYIPIEDIPYHARRTFTVLNSSKLIFASGGHLYALDGATLTWQ